ncbi:magnesium transporter CorA family protein [Oryzibacter oryziterrae]|uniref:magnesium transporter CorA family protein n=1 Tax=Oryzibacter oryziterrae TaxID=2766474 RepID=UPI001F23EA9D|nr:magnesium transporter CorA family protein [Oryzibacter oryziterrae]
MLNVFHPVGDRLEYAPDCGETLPSSAALWIDLMTPTRAEEIAIERFIGAELPTRAEMEEIELSSRLSVVNDVLYLTAVLPCRSGGNDPSTTAVTFVLTDKHLVTVRYDEPGSIPMAIKNVTDPGAGITTSHGALLTILEAAIDRLADVIEQSGARIEAIARQVFEADPRGNRSKGDRYTVSLKNIGREGMRLGHFQESLISLQRLISFLTVKMDGPRYGKEDVARLKPMTRDITALADHCRGQEERITFLLDATLGLISIQQNDIIKIFSVLAVIFMPPTLVASIYGMNFDIMPELHWSHGYIWAIGVMVLSAVGTFSLFRWKRWL